MVDLNVLLQHVVFRSVDQSSNQEQAARVHRPRRPEARKRYREWEDAPPTTASGLTCYSAFRWTSVEKWRNRELFHTTQPDESAMAAPAIRGLRNPNAARGMATTL